MALGPIFDRELLVVSRRAATYRARVVYAGALLIILGGNYLGWHYGYPGRSMGGERALFARVTFGFIVVAQVLLVVGMVPDLVARGIAGERDQKTLSDLLTTELTAAEIVLGKVGAALVQYGSTLAAGLPVMAALPFLGGVDPGMVLLAYAATGTTALFLAGLSAALAVGSTGGQRAASLAAMMTMAWLALPLPAMLLLPKFLPAPARWFAPVLWWVLASSPMALAVQFLGVMQLGSTGGAIARMMALESAAGVALILIAVATLRPAARRLEGGDGRLGRAFRRGPSRSWRPWPRPPVGDDPVLWKEMHTSQATAATRLIVLGFALALVGLLSYATVFFARPALAEVVAHGYGSVGWDSARVLYNFMLRLLSPGFVLMTCIMALSAALGSLATERLKDTWSGLLATPLTGREILRAKRLGALWKVSGLVVSVAAFDAAGLVAGALHPLGYLAALAGLLASTWFAVALGTYGALKAKDPRRSASFTLGPLMAMVLSPMACLLPWIAAPFVVGAASMPFVTGLVLASFRDVREAMATGAITATQAIGGRMTIGAGMLLATWAVAVAAHLVGAAYFTRTANARFDELVGRPRRAARPVCCGRRTVRVGEDERLAVSVPD